MSHFFSLFLLKFDHVLACVTFFLFSSIDEFMKDGITYFLLFTLCEDIRTIPYPFSLSFAYFCLANFCLLPHQSSTLVLKCVYTPLICICNIAYLWSDTLKFCVTFFLTFPIEIRPCFGLCHIFLFSSIDVKNWVYERWNHLFSAIYTVWRYKDDSLSFLSLSFAYFRLANFCLFTPSIINTRTQMRVYSTYLYM